MVGKEFDTNAGLNLYNYHARQYEPAIGRFTTIAPLAEKYYGWSPYVYVGNNPTCYIDPNGRLRVDSKGKPIFEASFISATHYTEFGTKYSHGNDIFTGQLVVRVFLNGYVFANDGTRINVNGLAGYNYITAKYRINQLGHVELITRLDLHKDNKIDLDPRENCHGYTFLKGLESAIDNGQISQLLKGDGYKLVASYKRGKLGDRDNYYTHGLADIVVYYLNGEVVHSAVISNDGQYSSNAGVEKHKDGLTLDEAGRGVNYDEVRFYQRGGDTNSSGK